MRDAIEIISLQRTLSKALKKISYSTSTIVPLMKGYLSTVDKCSTHSTYNTHNTHSTHSTHTVHTVHTQYI